MSQLKQTIQNALIKKAFLMRAHPRVLFVYAVFVLPLRQEPLAHQHVITIAQ